MAKPLAPIISNIPTTNGYSPTEKQVPAGLVSYEQFLEWADEDTHAEWVNGEIIMPSPASRQHQQLGSFLHHLIETFVVVKKIGGIVLPPFQMKLTGDRPGREPDLIFIAKEHLGRIQNTYLDGSADLAVEIVSPESEQRDRVTKFAEYAEAGVPEYWLLDPLQTEARFYQLTENGQYRQVALDSQGRFNSGVLAGFWLKPKWLWQPSLPAVTDLMLVIDGPAYIAYLNERIKQHGLGDTV